MFLRLIISILAFCSFIPAAIAVLTPSNTEGAPSHTEDSYKSPDTRSSSVLIPDTRSSSQNKPEYEITVEPNVVQIILNDEHRAGVDWAAIVSDFHRLSLKRQDDPVWEDKQFRLSFGTLSEDDYAVLLDALDMAGKVGQTSEPSVKLVQGKEAYINLEKVHIQLKLQLSRLKSGDLSLRVDPQMSIATTEILNGQRIPASIHLQTRTDMLLANNMTIVVGGLMKEEEITRTRKFPLLGDLPIVGLVFRSRGRLMQKTETVIFLTVRANPAEGTEDIPAI